VFNIIENRGLSPLLLWIVGLIVTSTPGFIALSCFGDFKGGGYDAGGMGLVIAISIVPVLFLLVIWTSAIVIVGMF
jgi:hypothetical protein